MTPRLLITGGGGAGAEQIWKVWQSKYDLYFADADASAIDRDIPRERRVQIRPANDREFLEVLVATCRRLNIEVLAPAVDEELVAMKEFRKIAPEIAVFAPADALIADLLDKWDCNQSLVRHGLDAPISATGSEIFDFPMPCIIKPRFGRGSRGVMRLNHSDQIPAYLRVHNVSDSDVIVQEALPGTEFTVFAGQNRSGSPTGACPARILSKKGITLRAQIEYNPEVVNYCEHITSALAPRGPINIQLALNAAGRPKAFEINPRISTTFAFLITSHFDPLRHFLDEAGSVGCTLPPAGLMLQRNWKNRITEPVEE
jgi:carbamoyl-phosphate synthase large subunit